MKQAKLVFIPAAPLSHTIAAVETAKLLLARAEHRLSITVLIMNPTKDPTIETYIQKISSSSNPNLSFVNLPAPEGPPNPSPTFVFECMESRASHVREIVSDLIKQNPNSQVAGLVLDLFTTFFVDVAREFGLPSYLLSTCGACHLGISRHVAAHFAEIKANIDSGAGDDFEVSVACFSVPVPLKVMPGRKFPDNPMNHVIGKCLSRMPELKGIMVNTFYEFEPYAMDVLMSDDKEPKVYAVGPVLNNGGGVAGDEDVKKWLDGQPEKSVVFLCFGSIGSLVGAQVREIALALEKGGFRFLWSLKDGAAAAALPEGFLERTEGVGKVIGWAAQAAVLAHAAVGGFVSHCGWNSILESVWFGVPIAAFPMFAEQHLNAFEVVEELGMAEAITLDYHMDLTGKTAPEIVGAEEIEAAIGRVMAAEGVKKKVEEMQKKGKAALEEGGSSYKAQAMFIEDVMKNIKA